ncbi:MAG TPA: hypothetical protein ACFYEB_02890 [Candidatus Brocadiia bacterium]
MWLKFATANPPAIGRAGLTCGYPFVSEIVNLNVHFGVGEK